MSAKITGFALLLLLVAAIGIWHAALTADHRGALTVSFLSVGQGNAVLIEAPSGKSVLIDGGPDSSVLRALAARLPWWQHSLDLVISTSPAGSDSVGLVDALARYRPTSIIHSPVSGSDAFSRALQAAIAEAKKGGAETFAAERGLMIDLGDGAFIEMLMPDRDVSGVTAADGCTVLRVVYGSTAFLLPCSASYGLQQYLAYLDGTRLRADVLQVPAGGMKALSETFLGYTSPAFAVLSRSCDTVPLQSVADVLAKFTVEPHDTCDEGTIRFISNGKDVTRE